MINQEIYLLEEFKEKKPWSGNFYKKKSKFNWLLTNLCYIHTLPCPKLIIPKNPHLYKWTKNIDGDCWFFEQKIRIKNFSVITLLHEFKHWVDLWSNKKFKPKENKEKREWEAIYYSISRFYKVWPERINYLKELSFSFSKNNICLDNFINKYNIYDNDPNMKAILDIVAGKI